MLIGELATIVGVSTKTLRFYETDGLLPEPDRTPAGYPDYDDTAIGRADLRLTELEHTRAELLMLRGRLDTIDPADCHDGICIAITDPSSTPDPEPDRPVTLMPTHRDRRWPSGAIVALQLRVVVPMG